MVLPTGIFQHDDCGRECLDHVSEQTRAFLHPLLLASCTPNILALGHHHLTSSPKYPPLHRYGLPALGCHHFLFGVQPPCLLASLASLPPCLPGPSQAWRYIIEEDGAGVLEGVMEAGS